MTPQRTFNGNKSAKNVNSLSSVDPLSEFYTDKP